MFIGYICMSHRIPFGKDQVLKDLFSAGTRTQINMASNIYHLSSTPLKLHKLTTKSLILSSRFSREGSGPGEKESTASRVGIEPFLKHVFFAQLEDTTDMTSVKQVSLLTGSQQGRKKIRRASEWESERRDSASEAGGTRGSL